MTYEKWTELLSTIKDRFDVIEDGREEFDLEEGGGFLEFVIFIGPLGEMKMEIEVKPRVIDHHVTASRRAGGQRTEKLIYSEDENVVTMFVYRWDNDQDDWVEMDNDAVDALSKLKDDV